jgi:hypothetical protein
MRKKGLIPALDRRKLMRTLTTILVAVAPLAFVGHASAATQNVRIYGTVF